MRMARTLKFAVALFAIVCLWSGGDFAAHAAGGGNELAISVSRSELIVLPVDMAEVMVADPSVADVYVHGGKRISIIGKKIGRTNVKIFDKENSVIRAFDVVVGYDIPAIRRSLKNFFPHENIGVEVVNNGFALTGMVSNATVAENAMKIVDEFVHPAGGTSDTNSKSGLINLLQINSGQQVMLRVRVGEIQRTAMKTLGINLSASKSGGDGFIFATGGGIDGFISGSSTPPGGFNIPSGIFGAASGFMTQGNFRLSSLINALEENGLFKILAEPNLVALSGEKAEFLAGGEFPIPVISGAGASASTGVEFKQFGVSVQFIPYVLSENRIRMTVMPEVSEISSTNTVTFAGTSIPSLNSRRANTTVELAPGESFMIAGLLKDNMSSTINQIPGVGEIPVLSALFRSTAYQRNETELVIAVTPYLVDPLVGSDVRLPTDNFRGASTMEMFFYGALGTLSGDSTTISQRPMLEGPIGFMVD